MLVQRLGAVHIQAGLATVLWAVAGPLEPDWQLHRSPWHNGLGAEFYRHGLGLVAVLVVAYGVVVMAVPSFSRHDHATGVAPPQPSRVGGAGAGRG